MTETISFSYSKAKIIGGFVVWTFLLFLWLFLVVISLIWSAYTLVSLAGLFFVLFLLGWLDHFRFLRKWQQGSPALQLTPEKLVDNMNNISFAWIDIQAFKEERVNLGKGARTPNIAICLYNEEAYLEFVHGWKNKVIAQINSRFFGGAFSIETNALLENRTDVLNALNEYKIRFSS